MNKEYLEALKEIRDFRYGKDKLLVCQTEMYKTIKQALQRLESIDNANPSEALKNLDKLAKQIELDEDTDFWEIRNAHKTVEQALLKAQEQEKVLEIIFEKNVNIGLVKVLGSVGQYNQTYVYDNMRNVKWCLTEEEFDLLKRYIKNDN